MDKRSVRLCKCLFPLAVMRLLCSEQDHAVTQPDSEERAAPIRILIANLSGVLAQLVVQLIEQQPDMVQWGWFKAR